DGSGTRQVRANKSSDTVVFDLRTIRRLCSPLRPVSEVAIARRINCLFVTHSLSDILHGLIMRVNPSRPVSDDQAAPTGILRLYLVRHGVTAWNVEERLQGHTDISLTDEGLRQAERIADRLSALSIEAVWSSDLVRASATAEAIARRHGLQVQTTCLLRESGLGAWEGLTEKEIIDRG